MYLVVSVVLCLTAVPVTPSDHEIHKRMLPDEVMRTFGTTHDDVPNYEIAAVEVSSMRKRDASDGRTIRIRCRHEDVFLFLNSSDGILAGEKTPVTMAIVSGEKVQYKDIPNIMFEVGELLEDHRDGSSFILSINRNGQHTLDGHIKSKNLTIKSLPEKLVGSVSTNNSKNHVIFAPPEQPFQPDYLNNRIDELESSSTNNGQESPTVYPEMLLFVDSSTYRLHGSDVICVVRYVLGLWNLVDMKYRALENPKIRLNIARIVIATETKGTPYISSSMLDNTTMNAEMALTRVAKYLYSHQKDFPLTSYDVFMLMTNHVLRYSKYKPAGIALPGGACDRGLVRKHVLRRVGIFADKGFYRAIVPTHELGHLLGAIHDDNATCSSHRGYIMQTDALASEHNWNFSPCSIKGIRNFIRKNGACLGNPPKRTGRVLPKFFPVMTLDEHCRIIYGTRACTPTEFPQQILCSTFACVNSTNEKACVYGKGFIIAEGTPCDGEEKICLQGRCVNKIGSTLEIYSQD